MRQFTAGPNDDGARLSRFVLGVCYRLPNALLYKSFRTGRIKVNGKKAEPQYRLRAGDAVMLYLNDEFFAPKDGTADMPAAGTVEGTAPDAPAGTAAVTGTAPRAADAAQKAAVPPAVAAVYADSRLAVLYKPAGVFSHRGERGQPGLLEAFTASLIALGEYDPAAENIFSPALAGRLDAGTEGLVLAAKTAPALRELNGLIRQGLVKKTYLCVTAGAPPAGTHRAFLARDRGGKTVKITAGPAAGAKAIVTEVAVLEEKKGLALCRVLLHTGRTHQIRAHLAFLGAPLAGDAKYGDIALNRRLGLRRQLLCAWQLDFLPPGAPESEPGSLAGKRFCAGELAALPRWWASC